MKNVKSLLISSVAIVGFLLAGTAAKADPLLITLDSPFQTSLTGDVLTFNVTVINTDPSNTVNLNGDSVTLAGPGALTVDDTGFWINSPLSLGPGASSGDFELFTVSVASGTPAGLYAGTFEIVGGGSADSNDVVGSVNFDVNVTPASSSLLPEPSSFLLLGIGMLTGLIALRGRNLRRQRIG